MPTESAQQALSVLRDASHFQWYVISLLGLTVYVYGSEIYAGRWNLVFAGLAFWGADWINEILNGIFFHLNGRAPLWGTPGSSAYVLLIGLNIEIMFMFAIAGIAWSKFLLPNPKTKLLGLPNRWAVALSGSLISVIVELLLNKIGALTWDWSWWDANSPWLIYIFGYLWFFVIAFWVHDMNDTKKQMKTVGALWALIAGLILLFGVGLRWI